MQNLNLQCFLQSYTSKDCIVCHPFIVQAIQNVSPYDPEQANLLMSPLNKKMLNSPQNLITENLRKKYLTSKDFYNVKIINDIIYNEPTHMVAVFKDYLIYDDLSEFLKRHYEDNETIQRLPKIWEFYEKYSKVFPNYVNLPENKFMYKNIERKQKLIDDKQRHIQAKRQGIEVKLKKRKDHGALTDREINEDDIQNFESSMSWLQHSQRFFDTKFMDSMSKQEISISHNTQHASFVQKSSQLDQSSLKKKQSKQNQRSSQPRNFAEMNLENLIQAFLTKDSNKLNSNESNITATLDITMPSFNQLEEQEKFVKSMLQQQQKQRELLLKQVQKKEVIISSDNGASNNNNVNQIPKYVFSSNNNPYLKSQNYYEKIKVPAVMGKRKVGTPINNNGSGSIQNSPQQAILQMVASPPKIQQVQQIYGGQNINQQTHKSQQQHQTKQSQGQEITRSQKVQNNNPPDFKIKHGGVTSGGSQSQRENSLSKKIVGNFVKENKQQNNYFSPLDIQDQSIKNPFVVGSQQNQPYAYYTNGSQSARIMFNDDQINSNMKRSTSLQKGLALQQKIQKTKSNDVNIFGGPSSGVFDYKTGAPILVPSLKHVGSDKTEYVTITKNKQLPPRIKSRLDEMSSPLSSNKKHQNFEEESKGQINNISSNILNSSNNHLYQFQNYGTNQGGSSQTSIQMQQQNVAKFMAKRSVQKQQTPINQNSNSNYTSGYNTQQTQTQQNLQQTNNSSNNLNNNTNQIMKVMNLDIADISTNLNNNSRNFLARQQQHIQMQKQSRGSNPRQKTISSVPKKQSQRLQNQQQQQMIFIGDNNPQMIQGGVNIAPNAQVNNNQSIGRQNSNTLFMGRNSSITTLLPGNENNIQYNMQLQQLVNANGSMSSRVENTKPPSTTKHILQNMKSIKPINKKSNSQNRARDFSPMDYQVQFPGSTIHQQSTARIKKMIVQPERRSQERPAKFVGAQQFQYQQEYSPSTVIGISEQLGYNSQFMPKSNNYILGQTPSSLTNSLGIASNSLVQSISIPQQRASIGGIVIKKNKNGGGFGNIVISNKKKL